MFVEVNIKPFRKYNTLWIVETEKYIITLYSTFFVYLQVHVYIQSNKTVIWTGDIDIPTLKTIVLYVPYVKSIDIMKSNIFPNTYYIVNKKFSTILLVAERNKTDHFLQNGNKNGVRTGEK